MVIIEQKTLREKVRIDTMEQLTTFLLKQQGCQDGAGVELTARSVGEPKDSAVLRAAIAVTAFVSGGDERGDGDEEFH